MSNKPRWVECADEAGNVLERAANLDPAEKEICILEAQAWMRLADIYRAGKDDATTT